MEKHIHIQSLEGKLVLITGAGKRVGADIARYMAARGMDICLHYRSSLEAAEGLKKEIEETYRVRVELVKGDLSREADVTGLFNLISPDVVILNAGAFIPDDFNANMKANAEAVHHVVKKGIARMLSDKRKGTFFLVGDAFLESGGVYPENLIAYTMSKAHIPYTVRQLASAHGRDGLRFIGILNGPIEPPPGASPEAIAAIKAEINLPEEELDPWIGGVKVGEAIYGLLLATAINGESVRVDGGRVPVVAREH